MKEWVTGDGARTRGEKDRETQTRNETTGAQGAEGGGKGGRRGKKSENLGEGETQADPDTGR